jgi:hypothetical protein
MFKSGIGFYDYRASDKIGQSSVIIASSAQIICHKTSKTV